MKNIIFILLIGIMLLFNACSINQDEITGEDGIQYAPASSDSGALSKIKSAVNLITESKTTATKVVVPDDYLYTTKYVVDGEKLNIYINYNIQELQTVEEFSQLATKIQTSSDIAIQIQIEVDGVMQQMEELIVQMMEGYDSTYTMPFAAGDSDSGAVYGQYNSNEGNDVSEQIADKDSDNDGIRNNEDTDNNNDGTPNSEDEDDDGDGTPDDEDDYPEDSSRDITAESESIMYLETMDALIESITDEIATTQFVSYTINNNLRSGTSYLSKAATTNFESIESQGEIAQGYVKNIKVVSIKTI